MAPGYSAQVYRDRCTVFLYCRITVPIIVCATFLDENAVAESILLCLTFFDTSKNEGEDVTSVSSVGTLFILGQKTSSFWMMK
jgi:hypothetical protein